MEADDLDELALRAAAGDRAALDDVLAEVQPRVRRICGRMLLFPEDAKEGFEMSAQAFDLAERLQTPVFVMLDLDIGMNERLCEPLTWDDSRRYDRGKVLTYQDLEAGARFGRYLDLDGDGITYRTYPGTHPKRGSFFTRGTSRDRYARYTEEGSAYVDNMQRLLKKFETAKDLVPAPVTKMAPSRA